MSEKMGKTRISVAMTDSCVEGLDKLVDMGLYMNREEILLEALRNLFRKHEIEPFAVKKTFKES